jgi:hydroxymethylglutaryl-CoA reductase (NADPH)
VKNQLPDDYVKRITKGEVSLHRLPEEWDEYQKARVRLAAVAEMVENNTLVSKIKKNGVVGAAAGRNAEQIIGELTVPLSVVGPLLLRPAIAPRLCSGQNSQELWVPLSTTEGALVASVQRGVKTIASSGGCRALAVDRGMTRAPVFEVKNLEDAHRVTEWLGENGRRIKQLAEETSSHLELIGIEPEIVGRNLYVRLRFSTGEAMGMNMVTIATQEVAAFIETELSIRCVALSGNVCVDKKAAWTNAVLGRGLWVQAEVVMSRDIVVERLKTTPKAMVEVVMRKDWVGSALSGSMGFNGHFANMVAGLYLATGQDMAHVVEGSMGMTTAELDGEDLYMSVTLPAVVVGTVGGGTHLPVQQAALEMLGLGQGKKGEKLMFGEIVGATVLAGEISLTAALSAGHLAGAHERLGRKNI